MESRAEAVSSGGLSLATPMFLRVKTLILLALLCSAFNTGVGGTFFLLCHMQVYVSIATRLIYCRGVYFYCKTNKFDFADFVSLNLFIYSCKA